MNRRAVLSGLVLVPVLVVTGCGGSSDPTDGKSAQEVLTLAKEKFDEAASVHMRLSTDARPSSGDAVLGAEGTLTRQPGFDGQVTVVLAGFDADVPVIAVDGKVYAKLPLTPRYTVIDPAEYGAPDPSDFADPDRGISGLLLKLDGAEKAGRKRDGDRVLTTYEGTLSGDLVEPIIPSADSAGSYETVVGIDEDGRIVSLRVTGDFFAHDGPVTYDLELDDYGKSVTVSAP
jgi:lipoprotein LprG